MLRKRTINTKPFFTKKKLQILSDICKTKNIKKAEDMYQSWNHGVIHNKDSCVL